MSGQFPPKKLSVAILSRFSYLQRRLTGLYSSHCRCSVAGSVCMCVYYLAESIKVTYHYFKRIKTGISGFKPRITQESITILISTVVL